MTSVLFLNVKTNKFYANGQFELKEIISNESKPSKGTEKLSIKTNPNVPPILPNCLGELDTVNDRSWPANQAGGRHHGGGGGGKFKQAVSH